MARDERGGIMQKKIIYIIMGILILSLVACGSDKDTDATLVDSELIELLPNEGFKWAYVGPAEYYHEMVLDSITGDDAQKIYRISGEVEDKSGGDSNADYAIDLYYEVNSDSIVQRINSDMALDNNFEALTLIKTPLEVGNKWTETIKDKTGKKITLESEIFFVEKSDNGMLYKVSYTDKKSDYSETRHILKGYGVIVFTQKVMIDAEEFNYGYGLFGKESGYNKIEEVADVEDDTTDSSSDDTSSTDSTESSETEESTDTSDSEETTDTSDTNDTVTEDTSAEDEAAVKLAIENFNDAWIKFVNENDQSIYSYVVVNGVAYNNAKKFDKVGLSEKFLVMNVNQVTVNGNKATAKVREEIEKTQNNEVTIAKYNWIYDLIKKDGKWLVNGYKKQ